MIFNAIDSDFQPVRVNVWFDYFGDHNVDETALCTLQELGSTSGVSGSATKFWQDHPNRVVSRKIAFGRALEEFASEDITLRRTLWAAYRNTLRTLV